MEQRQLIKNDTKFGDYDIATLMSHHHVGEREVYRAVDSDGRSVVLTVFNIKSRRYAADRSTRKRQPDFIDEVRFYKECAAATGHKDVMGLPKYLGCGIDTYGHHRYGWVAQEFIDGDSLDAEILRQGVISIKDAFEIVKRVSFIAEASARFTHGGGHYNISTDNIIVRYEGNELKDVRLVGFTNIGTAYSGNSPIEDGGVDNRFRAPETHKHIYSYRSDIYSLGMLLLLMLTGYPKVIHAEHYSIDIGGGTMDMSEVSSTDFYEALWKNADKNLSKALRLVLRKATDISPTSRFATIEKFNEFLAKIEKQELKTHTITEETKPERATATFGYSGGPQPAVPLIETAGIIGTTNPLKKNKSERKALDEVAGMADLKALFWRDFIRIVCNSKVAQAYGIKPSNCTLLYGPQGCGKTFIAEKAAQ